MVAACRLGLQNWSAVDFHAVAAFLGKLLIFANCDESFSNFSSFYEMLRILRAEHFQLHRRASTIFIFLWFHFINQRFNELPAIFFFKIFMKFNYLRWWKRRNCTAFQCCSVFAHHFACAYWFLPNILLYLLPGREECYAIFHYWSHKVIIFKFSALWTACSFSAHSEDDDDGDDKIE